MRFFKMSTKETHILDFLKMGGKSTVQKNIPNGGLMVIYRGNYKVKNPRKNTSKYFTSVSFGFKNFSEADYRLPLRDQIFSTTPQQIQTAFKYLDFNRFFVVHIKQKKKYTHAFTLKKKHLCFLWVTWHVMAVFLLLFLVLIILKYSNWAWLCSFSVSEFDPKEKHWTPNEGILCHQTLQVLTYVRCM